MFDISFSKYLFPSVEGFTGQYKEDWWIFTQGFQLVNICFLHNIFIEPTEDVPETGDVDDTAVDDHDISVTGGIVSQIIIPI